MSEENTFHIRIGFSEEHLLRDLIISVFLIVAIIGSFSYTLMQFKLLNALSIVFISFLGSCLMSFFAGCYIDALNKKREKSKRNRDRIWSVLRSSVFSIVIQMSVFAGILAIFIVIGLLF